MLQLQAHTAGCLANRSTDRIRGTNNESAVFIKELSSFHLSATLQSVTLRGGGARAFSILIRSLLWYFVFLFVSAPISK